MSYYWCNRQEILQKAKERYSKEKAVEYFFFLTHYLHTHKN